MTFVGLTYYGLMTFVGLSLVAQNELYIIRTSV